MVTQY
jgi:hypothetical protein